MIIPISSSNLANASPVPPAAPGNSGGAFDQALSATLWPLQQVPVVGTIFRAIANHPLEMIGSAAEGFLTGGPIGAAASAGLTALSDQVSGDTSVAPRTEAMLRAYSPLANS